MNYRRKSNILAVVVVILIVALIVGALAALSSGFTNWDVKTWFGGEEETVEEPVPEEETNKGGAVIGNSMGIGGMRLASASISPANYDDYGVSPMAEDAYTLTATITPATAANKNVSWTVAWVNGSSGWASGKSISSYLTLSPVGLSCTVSCLQPFGAQAVITCASADNADIKASCTVDFKERLSGVKLSITDDGSKYTVTDGTEMPALTSGTSVVEVTKTVGTVSQDFSATVTATATDEFADWIEDHYGNSWGTGINTVLDIDSSYNFGISFLGQIMTPSSPGQNYAMYGQYIYAQILSEINSGDYNGDVIKYTVTVTGGESPAVYTYECPLGDITVPVGSIELSQTGIIF